MLLSGVWHSAGAQLHGGIQQYYNLQSNKSFSVMPVVFMETNKNWYVECRYNYEAPETFSAYIGKTFKKTSAVSYSFSPMIGVVGGEFNGYSIGLNSSFEYKRYSLTSACQYTICSKDRYQNFAYSWTDIGYKLMPNLSFGLSLQQTKTFCNSTADGGIFVQATFQKWTVPVYMFNPAGKMNYFMVGINYEWKRDKRKSKR